MNGNTQTSTSATTIDNSGNDLWSSILDSVNRNRAVTTKHVVILGNHNSGKSTIALSLASRTAEFTNAVETKEALDLGLSYSCFNVGEESEEDASTRIGIYQLPSPLPPYPALLPLALSRSKLLDSLVVIVLNWERLWLFMRELRAWIAALEDVVENAGDGWETAEGRERLEAHIRCYAELSASNPSTNLNSSSSISQLIDIESPLPQGVLTTNLGLRLVIVCTKSDQMSSLERDHHYKEEQFDYIQQTLRTIALRYGAALFFTSYSRPTSFAKLRAYILHRLFSPSPLSSAPISNLPSAPLPASLQNIATATQSSSRGFSFPYRANVVDRDEILVPSGWDSWGKIKILKEQFNPEITGEGWECDISNTELQMAQRRKSSALHAYEDVIENFGNSTSPLSLDTALIQAQNESTFLQAHYETLQKDREKDPRNAFAARPNSSSMANGFSDSGNGGLSALGSIGSDRASTDEMTARLAKLVRKDGGALSPTLSSSAAPIPSSSAPILNSSHPPSDTSDRVSSSTADIPDGDGPQNEVLANFFQSLLAARTGGGKREAGVQELASISKSIADSKE